MNELNLIWLLCFLICSKNIIVDMLSVERHYILVKTYLIGGSTERSLPARTMPEQGHYPHTLFSKYTDLKEYVKPVAKSSMKQGEKRIAKHSTFKLP